MKVPLGAGTSGSWRLLGVFGFVVLGLLSAAVLAATHHRMTRTAEQSLAATDNLMSVRFALARAHLAWVRTESGDPAVEPTRPLAELGNASGHLSDLLEGRSGLLGLTARGFADEPRIASEIDSLETAIGSLHALLAEESGSVPVAEIPLRFSDLENIASELDRRVHELVRARVAGEQRAQNVFLGAWILFLVATGLGIEILRRARQRALDDSANAEVMRSVAEAELGEAERRLQNLRTLTDAGVLLVDEHGRIREMSRWWSRVLDMDESAWIGRHWWEALHAEEQVRMTDLWREKALRRGMFSLEARAPGSELGHDRWVTARWKPVEAAGLTEDGSWVGTFLDVTQHRVVESHFQQAQKLEAIGRMTSGIAHDFNNLLTVTLTNAELLRSDPGTDAAERLELIRDIERATASGRDLIAGLMSFSRKAELEMGRLDFAEAVREAMGLGGKLLPNDVSVVLDLPDPGPLVHGDARALQQILFNLVTNARDAMPDGGQLVITVDDVLADDSFIEDRPWITAGRFGRLTVTDNGVGMDRATLDQIFDPFFSTKPDGSGTGLGLASVHGLVRQQGGHIHAYSEVGVGTSFRLYLPLATEAGGVRAETVAEDRPDGGQARDTDVSVLSTERQTARRSEAERPPPRKGVVGTALRVLLVEDDAALRRSSQRVLMRLGYEVVTADDGDEALELLGRPDEHFDLVISDISMERVDGLEVLRRIRERGDDMPFVLTSGRHASQLVGEAVVPEDVAFLQKPWSVETLRHAIQEARLKA